MDLKIIKFPGLDGKFLISQTAKAVGTAAITLANGVISGGTW